MNSRTNSLWEVAEQSGSMAEFGFNFTDWLHGIRRLSSRNQLERAYADEPRMLEGRFAEGKVADAWLAAYAEHLASRIRRRPPEWAFQPARIAGEPWFSDVLDSPGLRASALARSPLAFKRRNLYTYSVELPIRLHPGRPRKPTDEKRKTNTERQGRFRARRKAEWANLRALLAASGAPAGPPAQVRGRARPDLPG